MFSRALVLAVVSLASASAACVGDDTVVGGGTTPVQGGSGPSPSTYNDATMDMDGPWSDYDGSVPVADAGTDAPADATLDAAHPLDATLDAPADASADTSTDAPGDADAGPG